MAKRSSKAKDAPLPLWEQADKRVRVGAARAALGEHGWTIGCVADGRGDQGRALMIGPARVRVVEYCGEVCLLVLGGSGDGGKSMPRRLDPRYSRFYADDDAGRAAFRAEVSRFWPTLNPASTERAWQALLAKLPEIDARRP